MSFDGVNGDVLTLEAFSNRLQRLALIPLDGRAVVVEVDRVGAACDELDLAGATHALLTLRACRAEGILSALWARGAATAIAVIGLRALLVVEALRTAALVAALLITSALDRIIAVPRDTLAAASGALHASTLTVGILTALLTFHVQAVLALVLTMPIVLALGVCGATGREKKRQATQRKRYQKMTSPAHVIHPSKIF